MLAYMAERVLSERVLGTGITSPVHSAQRRYCERIPVSRREALLAEFDQSGLCVAQFCRLAGISRANFYYWRKCRRRRSEPRQGQQPIAWLEAVVQQALPSGSAGLVLQLPGGVRAEITTSQHIPLAAALVRALEKPC